MKNYLSLPLLAVLLAASAPPVSVETADGDWSKLPMLSQRGYDHLNTKMMVKLQEIASQGQCRFPGQYLGTKLDLRMSFAAQYDTDGTLRRIVIPKMNCPEGEGVLGGALLEMMKGGDYRPTGKNPDGWYQGALTFTFEG
jgi:hypothetical protein